jgi:GntR family transcriptional regulator / MocR family aminotransferase
MRTPAKFRFPSLGLDPDSEVPLYQQLAEGVRKAVLSGELPAGEQIPPTRTVMHGLRISRNTAVTAFNLLVAEGVLTARLGSGVYVSHQIIPSGPGALLKGSPSPNLRAGQLNPPPLAPQPEHGRPDPPPALSRGAAILPQISLSQLSAHRSHRPFRPSLPDYREFPIALWEGLRDRVLRDQGPELMAPGDPAGYRPLREVLARYFDEVRGIRCQPDQVFVTGGLAETIQITGMVVLPPEGFVGMEEPGHVPAKAAFLASGARLVPLLVDDDGAIPPHGRRKNPPRLLYLTPAHQFPLGVPLSLPRRLGFLDFVVDTGAIILEDDYDREFWYRGSPPTSLFSLDNSSSTLYAASFGKLLFPALRLSCLIVPESRVEIFLKARAVAGASNSTIDQATLAAFFQEGHFAGHMRYLRGVCEHRLAILRSVFASEFKGVFELEETCAGLQTIAWLDRGWEEDEVASAGLAAGLEITPLGAYGRTALLRPGVVLGFAAWNEEEIRRAATRLALALRAKRAFSAAASGP